jgi:hypothetical protein
MVRAGLRFNGLKVLGYRQDIAITAIPALAGEHLQELFR